MAYVGFVINDNFCYKNESETITKAWTFNGENIYNALNTFNNGIDVSGSINLTGDINVSNNLKVSNKSTFTGNITSGGTNTWSGTQNFNGNINSSGTNSWTGSNTFTQTVMATAYSSLYGDIAELYKLNIDNNKEKEYNRKKYKGYLVQVCKDSSGEVELTSPNSKKVLGVVSEKPALLLNNEIEEDNQSVPVAYTGRVECFVIGYANKGDALTTSKIPGVAKKKSFWDKLRGKPTIGYALDDKTREYLYQIEIVVK